MRVRGSAEDLRTAVSNVLDNAVKYSGDHVDVRVRLEENDKRVVLSVQDHGVGIAQDDSNASSGASTAWAPVRWRM